MTRIKPASGKEWEEEIPELESAQSGASEIFNSALMLVAANLRMSGTGSRKPFLSSGQKHKLYGSILWHYLGDTFPSLDRNEAGREVGHVVFAYYLRKILEANPVVTRE